MEPQLSPSNTLLTFFFFFPIPEVLKRHFYKKHLIRDRAPSAVLKIQGKIVTKYFQAPRLATDTVLIIHFFIRNHSDSISVVYCFSRRDSCLSNVNLNWRKGRRQRENVLRFQFFIFSFMFSRSLQGLSIMKPNHALSLTNASRLDTSSGQVPFVCDEISSLIQTN